MFYEKVFKALNRAKVKYVVAGGVAVVLHGYQRFTHDLDLIVFLEKKNLDKFYETLKAIGYLPKVPVTKEQFLDSKLRQKWKKEKGMLVFSFFNLTSNAELVDMFVDMPIDFSLLYRNRKSVKIKGIQIPLIDIDHLIHLKKQAGRQKDLDDIAQLQAIQKMLKQ